MTNDEKTNQEDLQPQQVPALKVRQWLPQWDDMKFDKAQRQSRPKDHLYIFSLPASKLRSLAGIYRRSTESLTPREDDLGIQRKHDPDRSSEIRKYIEGGYPWSELSETKKRNPQNDKLKKPGWLPTAVVVNILQPGDKRNGSELSTKGAIQFAGSQDSNFECLGLPLENHADSNIPPIEIIDGQHRLFAFDENETDLNDYELPVVAFHGLDISWQAYLFWTINIKPKKINPSLAFDLYPLLREQDWLESGEVVHVYRESRAQELTEVLWSTPESPWYKRINMLGGPKKTNGPVTQAAFIRSLTASMVKSWKSNHGMGGIFGGTPDNNGGLAWSRLQQSAFLVTAWKCLADKILQTDAGWATALRDEDAQLDVLDLENVFPTYPDPAFVGNHSLLATDQGVRGYQYVINDLCVIQHRELELANWQDNAGFSEVTPEAVNAVAKTFESQPAYIFLTEICDSLATFDWRTSGAISLNEDQRLTKAALRGSGGYRELKKQLFAHLRKSDSMRVSSSATHLDD